MKKLIIFATVTTAVSASLLAQDAEPRGPRESAREAFQQLDVNNDQVVTHDELMLEAQKKFTEFDQNKNGAITLGELPERMPLSPRAERRIAHMKDKAEAREQAGAPRHERRGTHMSPDERAEKMRPTRIKFMARMDKNGDEQVNLEEFAAPLVKRFKRGDINGDGEVTAAEFEQSLEQRRHKRRGKAQKKHRR